MGKLVLRLHSRPDDGATHQRPGRLLQQLRGLKATLIRSTIQGKGSNTSEVFEFTTAGLAPANPTRRSPCSIRPLVEQGERVTRLAAIAQLGIALAGSLPQHSQEETSMSKHRPIRSLAFGKLEPEARRVFELARHLVRGEGPPVELRMPCPVVTVIPNGHHDTPPRNAWGVAGIGVGLEMHRPYPPVEAMVISGYILFGTDWPTTFKRLRLPASLEHAYVALEQHFSEIDRKKPDAIVTIPKPIAISQRPRPRATAIPDHHDARPALAPPERPQLTHQPTAGAEELMIEPPATRVR